MLPIDDHTEPDHPSERAVELAARTIEALAHSVRAVSPTRSKADLQRLMVGIAAAGTFASMLDGASTLDLLFGEGNDPRHAVAVATTATIALNTQNW